MSRATSKALPSFINYGTPSPQSRTHNLSRSISCFLFPALPPVFFAMLANFSESFLIEHVQTQVAGRTRILHDAVAANHRGLLRCNCFTETETLCRSICVPSSTRVYRRAACCDSNLRRFAMWMVVLSMILLCFNVMWLRSSASVPVPRLWGFCAI